MKAKEYNQPFGVALEALKRGERVTRPEWFYESVYLWMLPAARIKAEWCKDAHLKELAESFGGDIEAAASIRMLTRQRKVVTGWAPSQEDLFSEDWIILE